MNVTPPIPKRLSIVGAVVLVLVVPVVLYAQAPPKPPAPTLTPNHEERSVEISWTSILPPGGNVTWEVWAWTKQDGWKRLDDGNLTVTHFKHSGLEAGVTYWYTYRAILNNDLDEWSHHSSITLSGGNADSFYAPSVTAKLVGEDIVISWTKVSGATHYQLACWCGNSRWDIYDVWDELETRYRANPSKTYYFSVQARDDDGNKTKWSEYAIVSTPAVIPTNTPIPDPTFTPTPTPVPNAAYGEWLPGITIASESHCDPNYRWEAYGFDRTSGKAQELRERIVASMGGRRYDPYFGLYFGEFSEVGIFHVVRIREAEISGMCHPSRKKYANDFVYDLDNAVLTSYRIIYTKGYYDVAGWLPDFNQCWYVNQVVHVKRKYGLTMNKAEADAAIAVLSKCSSTDMIFSNSPTPTPTIVTNDPLQMYDDDGNGHISCEEARRHGIAPVHRVHPAYEYMDDPDGNGIACE